MKLRSIAALAVLFAMALSVAVGAPKNKKTINLTDPTRVGTVVLQPGDYTIEWTGTGSDVQVSFSHGKNTLVTVPATLEPAQNRIDLTYAYATEPSGVHSLSKIELKNSTLHFTVTDGTGAR